MDEAVLDALLPPQFGSNAALVVTVNGRLARLEVGDTRISVTTTATGDPGGGEQGAGEQRGGDEAGSDLRIGSVAATFEGPEASDALDDLAEAFAGDGVLVDVPARAEIAEPVVIIHLVTGASGATTDGRPPAVFPRTVVRVGEAGSAHVVEVFVSPDGDLAPALVVPATEIAVGDAAQLRYSAVQELSSGCWQLGRTWAAAGRDATLRCFTASLGGSSARSRTESRLDGQGGSAELLAVYLGDDSQVHDFRTLQEHAAPRTTSDLVFKGAVGGTARSVYSGMIRMRHGARGANAFQTNRNLVLSEGAHADSVPNLDIQENDVRCSHASAVGPIDAEQRFYLQSRGVPRAAAERLVVQGFFDELLGRADPAVADYVRLATWRRVAALTEGAA